MTDVNNSWSGSQGDAPTHSNMTEVKQGQSLNMAGQAARTTHEPLNTCLTILCIVLIDLSSDISLKMWLKVCSRGSSLSSGWGPKTGGSVAVSYQLQRLFFWGFKPKTTKKNLLIFNGLQYRIAPQSFYTGSKQSVAVGLNANSSSRKTTHP